MRDGVRLALDIHLPSGHRIGDKRPTILRQTRYFRSVELPKRLDYRWSRDAFDIAGPTRERFLGRGYAWVDVDVRGSGVSSGRWPLPWSRGEVQDGAEIVDYIVAQPWSNGRVGATGISYEGTTAEMLLVNEHPAVRAIAPRFSLFCAYEDVAFPGGVHLSWFTEGWSRFNRLLDDHRFHDAMAELVYVIARGRAVDPRAPRALERLLTRLGPERTKRAIGAVFGAVFRGGRRVDDDLDGRERARALLDHGDNGDVHALCLEVACRDDFREGDPDLGFSLVSPSGHIDRLARSGAAIYGYGGYFDGAYAQAAARRHASVPGGRLLLGPWGHAGVIAHQPFAPAQEASFAHDAELLRFFDLWLLGRDDGVGSEPPVRYFTLGENRWRSASAWPPPEAMEQRWFLSPQRSLTGVAPTQARTDLRFDAAFGTGERSRWRGLLAAFVPADYPDFAARTRAQLSFDSPPFDRTRVLVGHPRVDLTVRAQREDAAIMAYLADVAPDGRVVYLSEGQLSARHRARSPRSDGLCGPTVQRSFERAHARPLVPGELAELSFSLLPLCHRVLAGHRLRLVLTLGDADHFAPVGGGDVELLLGGEPAAALTLAFLP